MDEFDAATTETAASAASAVPATPTAPAAPIRKRPGILTLGRALGVTASAGLLIGLVLGPVIANHASLAADTTGAPEHTVTVSGTGQVSVAPDVADIVLGVSVQKPTVAAAQSSAATTMSAVIAAVQKHGIDAKDIVTVNISLSPVYDYSSGGSGKIVGQQFTNMVRVTVRSISNVAAVVDDAIAAGATAVQGITFRVGDPTAVQGQARKIAMADARSKADALTSSAGVSIKGVATITEVTTQSAPVYASAGYALDSKSASTPIQTGTTDVVIQVTVSYLIG